MKIFNKIIKVKTKKFCQFIDLTEQVKKFVRETKIKNGQVLIYTKHTTLALRINEKEEGFFKDFEDLITKMIPTDIYYRHNDLTIRRENVVCSLGATDCLNGHSHCIHLLLATSETVPIINGEIALGMWQRILAIELDCARSRQVIIQAIGE